MKKKEKINFVAIGIFIFVGLGLFAVGIYFAGKYNYLLGGGYMLNVSYTFLDDLKVGSKVRISGGVDIGYVNDIRLENDVMVTELIIKDRFQINRNATFHIFSTGLVGMKYVDVQGYDPDYGDYYEPNEYIIGVSPRGMALVFESLGSLGDLLMTDESMNSIMESFSYMGDLVESLNSLIEENKYGLRQSISSLSQTLQDTEDMMSSLDATIYNLELITSNLNDKIEAIDDEQIEEIVYNINSLTAELNTLVEGFNSEDSALSLLNDPEFTETLKNTAENLETLSETLRDKPNALFFGE